MLKELYKRGQIVWTIWKILCLVNSESNSEPTPYFLTRIKRLYEIDRDPSKIPTIKGLAFSRTRPKGSGIEIGYTAFDAFCLAIAVLLVDVGVKQVDAVFFVKATRNGHLREEFDALMSDPPSLSKQPRKPHDDYEGPTYLPDEQEPNHVAIDERRFMVVPRFEIKERLHKSMQKGGEPVILHPIFCHGVDDLAKTVREEFGSRYNNAILMETGTIAGGLYEILPTAPEFKRGGK